MAARITKTKQLDLIRDETLAWGASHWTLLRCDRSLSGLSIVNGSAYHWVEESVSLSFALERIGDHLSDVADDTQILMREAQKVKTAADQLRIDGYLAAVKEAGLVLVRVHDQLARVVQQHFLTEDATHVEPKVVTPQRVNHASLHIQLPVPSFSRGEVTWLGGAMTGKTVFPSAPYTTPATERARQSEQSSRTVNR